MVDYCPDKISPGYTLKTFVTMFAIFGVSLFFFLLYLSRIYGLSIPNFVLQLKNSLYYPNANLCITREIYATNILMLFYFSIIIVMIGMWAYFRFFTYDPHRTQNNSFPLIISIPGLMCLFLYSGIQQIHRHDHFNKMQGIFSGKNVVDKNTALFNDLYQFPRLSQNILNDRHQGTFITDWDLSQDPYMLYHRILSYYFYPKISFRFNNQAPNDVLFLFNKTTPLTYIPENYHILLESTDQNFILAIKNRP